MPTTKSLAIARVAHEANRAYCQTLKDYTHTSWDATPAWQRESVIDGVLAILDDTIQSPAESHAAWVARKLAHGWVWGPRKDAVTKQHPCLLDYDHLSRDQQVKDKMFFAIVRALA